MTANNSTDQSAFTGGLTLTNKAISFSETTIQLSNIAKFTKYDVVRRPSIRVRHMVIAAIVICIFLSYMYWGLVLVIPAAYVIYLGVKERQRPKLYALSLELNSGMKYFFASEDKEGIQLLYTRINDAIHAEAKVNYIVNFLSDKIEFNSGDTYNIDRSQAGAIGRNASGSASFNNAAGDGSSPAL